MKQRPSQCQIKEIPGLYPDQYRLQVNYKNRMVLSKFFDRRHHLDTHWTVRYDLQQYIHCNFHPDDVRIIIKEIDDFYANYDRTKQIHTVQDETRCLIDPL